MDIHKAGQEETLMEVMVDTNSLESGHRSRCAPAGCRGFFMCAVALPTVVGLVIVALVVGFILHFFMFTPSCSQDAKVNKVYNLTKCDEQGTFHIFTADKAAAYLIYGWVTLSDVHSKEVTLMQTFGGNQRVITTQKADKKEIFFFDKIKLVKDTRISISLHSTFTDSLFHVHEL